MPRRKRTGPNDPSIPKPPPRKEFERQSPDMSPKPDQRLLEHHRRPRPMSDREALDQLDQQIADEYAPPPAKELMVLMMCSVKKQPLMARFTQTSPLGWFFANSFAINEKSGSAAATLNSVPIGEMHWVGATCVCGAKCAPILCGGCNNYVCDGGVSLLGNSQRLLKCACGSVGLIEPTLKTVSAAQGAGAREPGKTSSSAPAAPLMLRYRGE
jgi:hypothetical protein